MDKRMIGIMTMVFLAVGLLFHFVFQWRLTSSITAGLIVTFISWLIRWVALPWLVSAIKDDFPHVPYAREMEAAKKLQPQKNEKGEVSVGAMVCILAFLTMLAVAIVGGCKEGLLAGILCAFGAGLILCKVIAAVILFAALQVEYMMSDI